MQINDAKFASRNARAAARAFCTADACGTALHNDCAMGARLFAKTASDAPLRADRLGRGSLIGIAAKDGGGGDGGDGDQLFGADILAFSASDAKTFVYNSDTLADGDRARVTHRGTVAKSKAAVKTAGAAIVQHGCGVAGGYALIIRNPSTARRASPTTHTRCFFDRFRRGRAEWRFRR